MAYFHTNFRFNSSGTLLFSVGEDNKVFVIETSLTANSEKLITSTSQRVQFVSDGGIDKFQPDFYVLGYLGKERRLSSNTSQFHEKLFILK